MVPGRRSVRASGGFHTLISKFVIRLETDAIREARQFFVRWTSTTAVFRFDRVLVNGKNCLIFFAPFTRILLDRQAMRCKLTSHVPAIGLAGSLIFIRNPFRKSSRLRCGRWASKAARTAATSSYVSLPLPKAGTESRISSNSSAGIRSPWAGVYDQVVSSSRRRWGLVVATDMIHLRCTSLFESQCATRVCKIFFSRLFILVVFAKRC